ncbi:LuxR C-terminal-related transcriptional regulator [Amycolatopsis thermoflava]|uniref:LuxR C-terminal-related transcriptional regulator n=1 Tax=Amycolatopsis thermoflava TaxID=84480 RepID=UPI0037FD7671
MRPSSVAGVDAFSRTDSVGIPVPAVAVCTAFIIDHVPLTRFGLRTVLESTAGVTVVGEAGTEADALARLGECRPSLVVAGLPAGGGDDYVNVLRAAKKASPPAAVLVMSEENSPTAVAGAINAGADSFVHKSLSCGVLAEAIVRTGRGDRVWLLAPESSAPSLRATESASRGMAPRENEILGLMVNRLSNEEIAQLLNLAPQTVKNYVSRILHKHGVVSRRELFKVLGIHGVPLQPMPRDRERKPA